MAQRRSEKILVHLEPKIMNALQQLIAREAEFTGASVSSSSYLRKIIIEHLRERELLTTDMIASMVA